MAYERRLSNILPTLVVSVQNTEPPGWEMTLSTRTCLKRFHQAGTRTAKIQPYESFPSGAEVPAFIQSNFGRLQKELIWRAADLADFWCLAGSVAGAAICCVVFVGWIFRIRRL